MEPYQFNQELVFSQEVQLVLVLQYVHLGLLKVITSKKPILKKQGSGVEGITSYPKGELRKEKE